MSFQNKVVLVTGGSSGIGAATAIAFSAEGAKVVIVGRNKEKLKKTSDECEKLGSKPLVIVADVSKDEDIKRIITETTKLFGKLDVLVNNAGIAPSASILDPKAMEVYDSIMSTNLRSAVYLTNLAAPYLVATKGNIINVSSVAAMGVIMNFSSAYCASKAGMDHFTRSVALELASKGVRANVVNPGPVKTDIMENSGMTKEQINELTNSPSLLKKIPLERFGDPEEIADLILFLASDKAKSITGSNYVSDNGMLLAGLIQL